MKGIKVANNHFDASCQFDWGPLANNNGLFFCNLENIQAFLHWHLTVQFRRTTLRSQLWHLYIIILTSQGALGWCAALLLFCCCGPGWGYLKVGGTSTWSSHCSLIQLYWSLLWTHTHIVDRKRKRKKQITKLKPIKGNKLKDSKWNTLINNNKYLKQQSKNTRGNGGLIQWYSRGVSVL